ncbi:hypothetical protein HK104_002525 [Borealophlyctis nickersoniae]|nr:hypothetical protein HK104_002525 [Borealophlyctis nickersoniae]
MVFYFDGMDKKRVQPIAKQLNSLGAKTSVFFDKDVTHRIIPDGAPKSEKLGIKVWNLTKFMSVINSLAPQRAATPRGLEDHLREERIFGPATNRAPGKAEQYFRIFKHRYLIVEDMTGVHSPILIKEYKDPTDSPYPPWPRLYFVNRQGRCPFTPCAEGLVNFREEIQQSLKGKPDMLQWAQDLFDTFQSGEKIPRLTSATAASCIPRPVSASLASGLVSGSAALLPRRPLGMNQDIAKLSQRAFTPAQPQKAEGVAKHEGDAKLEEGAKHEGDVKQEGNAKQQPEPVARKDQGEKPAARTKSPSQKTPRKEDKYKVMGKTFYSRNGYCENCNVKFASFQEHVRSKQHKHWARDEENFKELDNLLAKLERPVRPDLKTSEKETPSKKLKSKRSTPEKNVQGVAPPQGNATAKSSEPAAVARTRPRVSACMQMSREPKRAQDEAMEEMEEEAAIVEPENERELAQRAEKSPYDPSAGCPKPTCQAGAGDPESVATEVVQDESREPGTARRGSGTLPTPVTTEHDTPPQQTRGEKAALAESSVAQIIPGVSTGDGDCRQPPDSRTMLVASNITHQPPKSFTSAQSQPSLPVTTTSTSQQQKPLHYISETPIGESEILEADDTPSGESALQRPMLRLAYDLNPTSHTGFVSSAPCSSAFDLGGRERGMKRMGHEQDRDGDMKRARIEGRKSPLSVGDEQFAGTPTIKRLKTVSAATSPMSIRSIVDNPHDGVCGGSVDDPPTQSEGQSAQGGECDEDDDDVLVVGSSTPSGRMWKNHREFYLRSGALSTSSPRRVLRARNPVHRLARGEMSGREYTSSEAFGSPSDAPSVFTSLPGTPTRRGGRLRFFTAFEGSGNEAGDEAGVSDSVAENQNSTDVPLGDPDNDATPRAAVVGNGKQWEFGSARPIPVTNANKDRRKSLPQLILTPKSNDENSSARRRSLTPMVHEGSVSPPQSPTASLSRAARAAILSRGTGTSPVSSAPPPRLPLSVRKNIPRMETPVSVVREKTVVIDAQDNPFLGARGGAAGGCRAVDPVVASPATFQRRLTECAALESDHLARKRSVPGGAGAPPVKRRRPGF